MPSSDSKLPIDSLYLVSAIKSHTRALPFAATGTMAFNTALRSMARPRSKSRRQYVSQSDAIEVAASLNGAKRAPLPKFIEPCLATLRDKAPSGDQWIHEIKFDGYRLQLRKDETDIRFYTRRGEDWTDRFEALITPAWTLPERAFIVDGEVAIESENGTTDFGALQKELGAKRSDRLTFFAFDILHIESLSLLDCAQIDRKAVLAEVLRGKRGPIKFSAHIEGEGEALFKQACNLGIEGLVSKRKDARYRSGRNTNWIKRTCRQRDTFALVGIAYKRGNKFDGIYLGRRDGRELLYAGKVENGFDAAAEKKLSAIAERLKLRTQPLTRKVNKPKAVWLKPEVLVDVEYRALTGETKVRHPSFVGFREDLESSKKSKR